MNTTLHPTLANTIARLDIRNLTEERKGLLQPLISYIQLEQEQNSPINLNFICTHNSRRSQFAQIWAQTAAYYYGIKSNSFSGGVEVTAFNKRAVASIERAGFEVSSHGKKNPTYSVSFAEQALPLAMFSKFFNDASSPTTDFAAVITCSHADKNCPFIPSAEARISLLYKDPKEFDDTPQETAKYNERSLQIAAELFYVFSQIKK